MPIVFKQVTPDMHKQYTAIRDITITCEDEASLTEMYDAFDDFLRACGYTVPSEDNSMVADFGNDPYREKDYDLVFQRELKET